MRIGILILNYKTFLDTERVVDALLSKDSEYNIIIQVVDNASPNDSYKILCEKYKDNQIVRVNQSPINGGFAKGNNYGLRLLEDINPDYVVIINNDVYFDISIFDKLVKKYEELPDAGVLSPLQKLPSGEFAQYGSLRLNSTFDDAIRFLPIISSITFKFGKKWAFNENTQYKNVQNVDIIPGCFMFVNYDYFRQIGFFDESTFLYCEERFVYMKVKASGRRNYLLLGESYIHDHSKTIKQEVSSYYQNKYLLEGILKFTKAHRSCSCIKCAIIRLFFYIGSLEELLISRLRKLKMLVKL